MAIRILHTNFFDEATISVTPSAVSTLPITNLQSSTRDRLWRSPNAEQQVISGSWGGNARPINAFGIWPGNLIGARVRLQLFSDAAYTTQVYDTGTLDVFTYSGTGWGDFDWGAHPWGVEATDLMAARAPLLRYFTEITAGSFKVTITARGAHADPYFEASRIWLSQSVAAPYHARPGVEPRWNTDSEHQRTGGVLRRIPRGKWRELRFETLFTAEADRAAWSDIVGYCSTDREVVVSLYPGEGTRRERDFTVMGSLDVLNPAAVTSVATNNLQLSIVES